MKSFLRVAQVITLLITTIACGSSNPERPKQADPFYEGTGDLDSIRIPLINPYEAIKADGSSLGWYVNLNGNSPYFQIQYIEQITVESGVIMLYAPTHKKILPSDSIWHWVVIVPSQNTEAGFDDEQQFIDYVQTYAINDPAWQEPLKVFQEYERTGCGSWIPNCNLQTGIEE